jgi:2'-5' RNA ligase
MTEDKLPTSIYGLVSLLPEPFWSRVMQLWDVLELTCGTRNVRVSPIPHITWLVMESYNPDQLKTSLQEISQQACPISVQTSGLGIFSGESPVLYISVVKNEFLLRLHALIYSASKDALGGVNPFYTPDTWVPHITLVHGDVDPDALSCTVKQLGQESFDWKFALDHLALIGPSHGKSMQVLFECYFTKQDKTK